jgi:A/G-specific adenine glycosylase
MDKLLDSDLAGRFTRELLAWSAANPRPLPWKGVRDPYLIWLSEIILQQTRVEQGLPYFERFRQRFPTIGELAAAPEDEVYKLWEGLGYYSRARNMLAAARQITEHSGGAFPDTYEGIRALKGVGPYTAAAIASFAFDLPHAVVDGNVYRVLARVFGLDEPVDTTGGKRLFAEWAQALLDEQRPGAYNQAIMDFGALQCKPARPQCPQCPMRSFCRAFQTGQVDALPVKSKRLERKTRYFHYLVLHHEGRILLRKRMEKDIWQHLYDFPLAETGSWDLDWEQLQATPVWKDLAGHSDSRLLRCAGPFRQTLSHQHIVGRFWEIDLASPWQVPEGVYVAEERKNLCKFAFPKIIDLFLNDNSLFLDV